MHVNSFYIFVFCTFLVEKFKLGLYRYINKKIFDLKVNAWYNGTFQEILYLLSIDLEKI